MGVGPESRLPDHPVLGLSKAPSIRAAATAIICLLFCLVPATPPR